MLLLALTCGFPTIFFSLVALNILLGVIVFIIDRMQTIFVWAVGLFFLTAFYELCVNFPITVMSILAAYGLVYIIEWRWGSLYQIYHWAIDYDDDE
jgi:hypothetical protein